MTISDIQTKARNLVDADAISFTDANLLIEINNAYEEIAGDLIATSYEGWKFGDSNYTALPTGLFTLVNSQETYQLTGNGTTGIDTTTPLLNVIGVSIKDNNGIWKVLTPIHLAQDIFPDDPVEYFKTDGQPQYYEKREDFLILYPAPDNGVTVTLTSGLKVFFQRTADKFTAAQVTTGTKTPGFASPYHVLLSFKAALDYALTYKPERVPMIMNGIARLEKKMFAFYAQRSQDERKVITMRQISYK